MKSAALALLAMAGALWGAEPTHGYADSNGVKIHYASIGRGPLVVMIHGFPDYWYTWRHQMEALAPDFQVVAIDQRGYNLSDKPKGDENYDMRLLIGDVAAVITHLGQKQAIVVGHDWGGAVAWQFAMWRPEMVSKLIILNLPHPNGFSRELANNPQQQANSAYARRFQQPGSEKALTSAGLSGWVKDPVARQAYLEAFDRSDFAAMMAYYRRNYPREPYRQSASEKRVKAPVLQIHGLADTALLASGLDGTWAWVDAGWTLVTVPGAGHFVQQDAADLVSRTIKDWLLRN